MKYYQVLNSEYEVVGTFADFATAQQHMQEDYILRYFDGQIFIYNVTKPIQNERL